jgi:hypothetical protein
MRRADYLVFPDVSIERETLKAFLCNVRGVEFWAPKSQIDLMERALYRGYYGRIHISRWFLRQAQLEWLIDGDGGGSSRSGTSTDVSVLVASTKIYRRLATKYHPDVNPAGGGIMRDINELWQSVRADVGDK